MKAFIKTFIVFIYFFLALFIRQTDTYACEINTSYISHQYYISQTQPEPTLTNDSKKEYYIILQNRNRGEITNQQNRHNDFGCTNCVNKKFAYNIPDKFFVKNVSYPDSVSLNISKNIEHTIYTRAP